MLFDTSTWIEFFRGNEKGKMVEKFLESQSPIYTSAITIAELSVWCHKNNLAFRTHLDLIKRFSNIIDLTEPILEAGGKVYFESRKFNDKISLIDCIIYATARIHGFLLLTKDGDFRGFDGIEFI